MLLWLGLVVAVESAIFRQQSNCGELPLSLHAPESFGAVGTTIVIEGRTTPDATQAEISLRSDTGARTFYLDLRFLPFEDSIFITSQNKGGNGWQWNTANDEYPTSDHGSPLTKGGPFRVQIEVGEKEMLVDVIALDTSKSERNIAYKHRTPISNYKTLSLSGHIQSVSALKVLSSTNAVVYEC